MKTTPTEEFIAGVRRLRALSKDAKTHFAEYQLNLSQLAKAEELLAAQRAEAEKLESSSALDDKALDACLKARLKATVLVQKVVSLRESCALADPGVRELFRVIRGELKYRADDVVQAHAAAFASGCLETFGLPEEDRGKLCLIGSGQAALGYWVALARDCSGSHPFHANRDLQGKTLLFEEKIGVEFMKTLEEAEEALQREISS